MSAIAINRRKFLGALAGSAVLTLPQATLAQGAALTRPIPSSGEALPLVGLGSWITFNVGNDREARDSCADVMRAFFAAGGRMIDSSPMYGSSQPVIGYGLQKFGAPNLFSAEKVWTSSPARGPAQIEASRKFWNVPKFDLLQVHNLLAWEEHLRTLFAMKAGGQVRYVGITTSEGAATPTSRRSWRASRSTSCRSATTCSTARSRTASCRSRASAASR